jgi:hypothetical protein
MADLHVFEGSNRKSRPNFSVFLCNGCDTGLFNLVRYEDEPDDIVVECSSCRARMAFYVAEVEAEE